MKEHASALVYLILALALMQPALALAPVSVVANGTSSSATPGTLIAQLDAGAGNQLVAINGHTVQQQAIGTQTRVTVTYTDATTLNVDSPSVTATANVISNAGIVDGAGNAPSFFDTAKKIQKIRVETLSTGTGTRWAGLSAVVVPATGWPDTHDSLIKNTAEAAGANCLDTGTKTETGKDDGLPTGTADNGILEAGEIDSTFFTCRGRDAGIRYTYSTSTSNADPGAGSLRFDSTTFNAVTSLRMSETDGDGNANGGYYATWDDSAGTTKGTLLVTKNNAPSTFAVFSVINNGIDNGAWMRFDLTFLASGGTFSNGDIIKIRYEPTGTGPTGEPGPQGPQGPEGPVASNVTIQSGELDVRFPTAGDIQIVPAILWLLAMIWCLRNGKLLAASIATMGAGVNVVPGMPTWALLVCIPLFVLALWLEAIVMERVYARFFTQVFGRGRRETSE